MLAGCGALDAHTIRNNCCALISLLASAVLATAATATTGSGDQTTQLTGNGQEAGAPPEDHTKKGGGALGKGEDAPLGGGDWNTFVPMSAKPNPDVVCLVRRKGWAARQQQQQQQRQQQEQLQQQQQQQQQLVAARAAAAKRSFVRSRASGGNGPKNTRHRRRAAGNGSDGGTGPGPQEIPASGAQHRSRRDISTGGVSVSPGKPPNRQLEARNALLRKAVPSGNGPDTIKTNSNDDQKPRAGAVRSGNEPDGSALAEREPSVSVRGLVPDCLASPPRLSRATRAGGFPALGPPPSSGWSSPPAPRSEAPLGLSTPGGGDRRITSKVGRPRWTERAKSKYC